MSQQLIDKTRQASEKWQSYFNQGDAGGCASMYELEAEMVATPFGRYQGREAIQAFWQQLVEQGFADVRYLSPNIEVLDESSTLLTSHWSMNNARGIITRELWVLQEDGEMRLREDHFEASDSK